MIVVPFWFLFPHVMVVGLANVEMVLPILSWKQNDYGNIAVTVHHEPRYLWWWWWWWCVLWGGGGHDSSDGNDSSDGGGVMVLLVVGLE